MELLQNFVQAFTQGPFMYYVIKELGGWGQKMAIFDDLQYCKSSKRQVGGSKKSEKHDDVILEWSLNRAQEIYNQKDFGKMD